MRNNHRFIFLASRGAARGRSDGGRGRGCRDAQAAAVAAATERVELVQKLHELGIDAQDATEAVKSALAGSSVESIVALLKERRVAPDGQKYTKQEFVQYFGGLGEWDAAAPLDTPRSQATQLQAAHLSHTKQKASAMQPEVSERRTAPDGNQYTKPEFQSFFSGLAEWNAAGSNRSKLPPPKQLPTEASRESAAKAMARTPPPPQAAVPAKPSKTFQQPAKPLQQSSKPKAGKRAECNGWPMPPPLRSEADVHVLHVAEKPSIAAAIARALSGGKGVKERGGVAPVHEFASLPFIVPSEGYEVRCTHRVTAVVGHVFSTDFPPQYQNWSSTDPTDLFTAPIVRKPTKQAVVKHLEREAKGCDVLVLWLDCDRAPLPHTLHARSRCNRRRVGFRDTHCVCLASHAASNTKELLLLAF